MFLIIFFDQQTRSIFNLNCCNNNIKIDRRIINVLIYQCKNNVFILLKIIKTIILKKFFKKIKMNTITITFFTIINLKKVFMNKFIIKIKFKSWKRSLSLSKTVKFDFFSLSRRKIILIVVVATTNLFSTINFIIIFNVARN